MKGGPEHHHLFVSRQEVEHLIVGSEKPFKPNLLLFALVEGIHTVAHKHPTYQVARRKVGEVRSVAEGRQLTGMQKLFGGGLLAGRPHWLQAQPIDQAVDQFYCVRFVLGFRSFGASASRALLFA